MVVLLVGACVVFVLEWRKKERKRQTEKLRQRKLQREYPQLVEQLALLIGSGMTIRRGMGTYFVDGRENAESTWKSDSFVSGGDADYLSGDAERVWRERGI